MPMPACKGCTKHSACGHSDDVWYFKGCALNDASASAAVVVPCRCSCGCSLLLLLLLFFFFLTRVVGINLSHGKRDRFLFGTHLQQCRELLCEILLAYSTASKGVSLWQNGSGSARKGGASLSPAAASQPKAAVSGLEAQGCGGRLLPGPAQSPVGSCCHHEAAGSSTWIASTSSS